MKGLMELLAKSDTGSRPSESSELGLGDGMGAEPVSPESFDASASAAMDAMKSGDTEAFAEALRACIEMSA